MGEELAAPVIRCEKANDLAMAGAAIEVILLIEDDILGTFELAKPDRLGRGQAVVEREGAGRSRKGGLAPLSQRMSRITAAASIRPSTIWLVPVP